MATLDTIRGALRIPHNKLDSEIERMINTGKKELLRVGVAESVVEAEGELVVDALIPFCLSRLTEDVKLIDKYDEAFYRAADGLRKDADNV